MTDGRTGFYAVDGLPGRAGLAWTAATDAPVVASPVLAGDAILAADAACNVYAWNTMTGELRRRHDDLGRELAADDDPVIVTDPALWNSWVLVYEGEYSGRVYVHDVRTGEVLRTIEGGGCPTVEGDVLLLHELNDGVWALALPTLETLWHRKGEATGGDAAFGGWVRTSPAISPDGTAYAALGFEDHHTHSGVTAFEVATGEEVFELGDDSQPCPGDENAEDWVLFSPTHAVAAQGLVWMTVDRNHEDGGHDWPYVSAEVAGLDPRTGERRWTYRLDLHLESQASGSGRGGRRRRLLRRIPGRRTPQREGRGPAACSRYRHPRAALDQTAALRGRRSAGARRRRGVQGHRHRRGLRLRRDNRGAPLDP